VESPNNNHTSKINTFQYIVVVKGYIGELSLLLQVAFNIGHNLCAGFNYSLGKIGVLYHRTEICDFTVHKV